MQEGETALYKAIRSGSKAALSLLFSLNADTTLFNQVLLCINNTNPLFVSFLCGSVSLLSYQTIFEMIMNAGLRDRFALRCTSGGPLDDSEADPNQLCD